MIQTATDAAHPLHTLAKLPQTGEGARHAPTIAINGSMNVGDARDIYLALDASDVASAFRDGSDLILVDAEGATLRLTGFFEPGTERHLYLEGDDNRNVLLETQAALSDGPLTLTFIPQAELSPFISLTEAGVEGAAVGALGAGGLASLAAAGLAAIAAGGGGGSASASGGGGSAPPPDSTAPLAPTSLRFDTTGALLSGAGEVGTTVIVRNSAGAQIGTGVVGADGTFVITLSPALTNNEQVSVTLADLSGNASDPGTATAPDLTAPSAPTGVALSNDGGAVTGLGEPGATVTIRGPGGAIIGTGSVSATGAFTVSLAPPLTNGETVSVTQADGAGNVSGAATANAPDTTAPTVPTNLDVSDNGGSVTGSGEPGSTVTVRGPGGSVIGTGTVGASGTFTVPLTPALTNGQTVAVTLTDATGNVSGPGATTAPDSTAPGVPTNLDVADNGGSVTGNGEPGATVTVRGPGGGVIGTGTVGANGTFTVPLAPALTNGETVAVTLTDATGNVSAPGTTAAPDSTAPGVPTNLDVADNGGSVTGNGEPGSTVTVRGPGGGVIGTGTVAANGTFTVPLSPAMTNGETVTATQRDAAGNVSGPATATATDSTAPNAPTNLDVADNGGSVTGNGEPGSTVTVRGPSGGVIGTGTVGADGAFTVPLTPALTNGESVTATLTDGARNVSGPAAATAPDATAPGAPTNLDVSDDGAAVTGNGEPGATVTVRGPGGGVIGTGTVSAGGTFSVALTPALINRETVTATQSDAAANVSRPATAVAPDLVTPGGPNGTDAPVLQIAEAAGGVNAAEIADGVQTRVALTPGTQVGDRVVVTVTGAGASQAVERIVTAADLTAGAVSITLPRAGFVDGNYSATAVILDADGHTSATSATVRILVDTATPAPVVTSANGQGLSGTAEAGATLTFRDAAGAVAATTTVGADGRWTLAASQVSGQIDGLRGTITAVDAAGNTATGAFGPVDGVTPAPVISAQNGAVIAGSAEAGATLTLLNSAGTPVLGADGQPVRVVVGANGQWSIPASAVPGGLDGFTGSAAVVDGAGNTASAPVGPIDGSVSLSLEIQTVAGDNIVNIAEAGSAAVTVTGRAIGDFSVGEVVTVTLSNGAVATAVIGAGGTWSASFSGSDLAASTGATARTTTTDDAGNTVTVSDGLTYAVDLTPPTAPVVQVANGQGLSGTAEAGVVLILRDGAGATLAQTTVGADGRWTVPAASVSGGLNGFTGSVQVADPAGNTATSPVGPVDGVTVIPTLTTANGASLTGTAEAGATVTLVNGAGQPVAGVNGAAVTATVGTNGVWTIPGGSVPGGLNGFTGGVVATDPAGNTGSLNIGPVDGLTQAPVIIAANGAGLTGTAEAGATIVLTSNGSPVLGSDGQPVRTTAGSNGGWSFPATAVPSGLDGFTGSVQATDPAGNTASSPVGPIDGDISVSVVVDPVTTDNVVNGAEAAQAGVAVSGRLIGEYRVGDIVQITLTGGVTQSATVGAGGVWTTTFSGSQLAAAGSLTATVTATDTSGNTVTVSDNQAFGVDLSTTTPVIQTANGAGLSGVAEAGAAIVLRDGQGATVGTATAGTDGRWTIAAANINAPLNGFNGSVLATDAAGNTATAAIGPVDASIVVQVSIASVTADNVINIVESGSAGIAVSGIVTGEFSAGDTVRVTLSGGTSLTATVAANGAWSVNVPGATLAASTSLTASITSTDAAGNTTTSTATQTYGVDLVAPTAPVILTANGAGVTGVAEAGAAIVLRDGQGATVGTATAGTDGRWTIAAANINATLNGFNGSVLATDAAGNTATAAIGPVDGSIAVQLTIASVTADNVINIVESGSAGIAVSGVVTGEFSAGDTVRVTLSSGASLTTTVAANGAWSVNVPGATLAASTSLTASITSTDAAGNTTTSTATQAYGVDLATTTPAILTANGAGVTGVAEAGAAIVLRNGQGATVGTATAGTDGRWTIAAANINASLDGFVGSVLSTNAVGNAATVSVGPVDASIAVQLTIASVTADNVVNLVESGSAGIAVRGVVTGEFSAGDTVRVTLNGGASLTTTVAANGAWSVNVPGATLAASTSLTASITSTDAAGNTTTSTATQTYGVDLSTTTPVIQTANGAGLSGVAEAGAAIVLRDGQGATVGTATAGTDGRWTIAAANINAPLNGFNGSVLATDAAGNTATAAIGPVDASIVVQVSIASVTADNVINIVESGSAGIAVSGVVTGEFSAGDTVRVTLGSGASLTATVAANGAWSVNVPGATLAASTSLTASVTSTDAAGNTTTSTATQTYGVDLVAPTAPVLTQANAAGVAGSGEAGSVVQLLNGSGTPIVGTSGQPLTATVGQDGRWSLPASVFSGGVTPSGLSGQLAAVDTAGNVSTLTPLPPIDVTSPSGATTAVTIGVIAGDDVVNQAEASSSITIRGQVTGEYRVGDVVTVTTAGGSFTTTVAAGGLYSISAPGAALSGGTIQVAVAASDAAGNVGNVTATRGYTVDVDSPGGPTGSSAPVLTIVAAADGLVSPSEIGAGVSATIALTPTTRVGDTLTLSLTGSGAPQTVAVVLTAQQIANGSAVVPIGALLADGAATVTAVIRDTAGNSSAPSATLSFNVDLVPIGLGATTATVSEANIGAVVTGALPVTGATGAVTYALQAPQGTLTSLGQTVTWNIDGSGVLIGSAGGREVLRASIGSNGQYRIVLSGAIDHAAQGADSVETRIGVSVTDATGTTTGVIAVGIVDGVPQVANTSLAPTQPGVYIGDLVDFGADGGRLTSVTIDGRTFVYNSATDTVTLSGATTTLIAHTIDDGLLSVTTVRGETVTVDFDTGEYRVVVTGVDSAPIASTAPSVALGGGQGLLGLIDADVLGLIQLDEQQFFSVSDVNNDTSEVTVRYEALLGLGLKTFSYNTDLATELGLTVTQTDSFVLAASSQLVIRSSTGGAIDNLRLNEFLGSITIAGGLSALLDVTVAQALSIQARDLGGHVTMERETNLADLGVAAGLLRGSLPAQTIIAGTGGDVRTASDVGSGAALDNRMYGLGGDDVLNGGLGNDILRGGSGSDTLNGGSGNDILIGGTGADTLTGGSGVDVFRWERGDQGTVGAPTTDTVTDFNVASALLGGDVLDLSSLLIGEGRIGSNPGNLSNFIHFELSGGSTRVLISTTGGFVGGYGSPTSGAPDQIIVLSNVNLVTGFGSDQAILADLLTRGKLVVDTLTVDGSTAPNTLTLTGSAIDGDGDLATASVTLNSANVVPAAAQASNSAPAVGAQAQSVLGVIGLGALGLNLNSQDLLVADVNNNLSRVELAYSPVLALNLTPLAFAYANGLAAQYGYSVQVTQSAGLLGAVAPTARIVITALDNGVLDNVEINRFLESVHLTDTGGGLLSSTLLSANVLSALTLTATDAQGAGSSAVLGQVLNVNLLNSLDGPDAASSAAFSAALDIGPERTSPLEPTSKDEPAPDVKTEEPCIFPPLTAYSVDATGGEVIWMPGDGPDHSHAGAGTTFSLTDLIADFTEDGWSDADYGSLSDPPRPAEEVLAQWTPLTIPQDEGAYAS